MKKKHLFWIIPVSILLVATIGFFIYTGIYYHAESVAYNSLKSNEKVEVTKKDYYYFFDSENETEAVILYPGAKVETEAYAPLCMSLASKGVDVFLVDMPYHLAFFGLNRASGIIDNYNYEHFYVGGHSLGGACSAKYASNNTAKVDGVIMLAAYTTDKLDSKLNTVLVYGSNDLVLNKDNYNKSLPNANNYFEYVINGGNHASFAYYGEQKGDGKATITKEQQIEETVDVIIKAIHNKEEK